MMPDYALEETLDFKFTTRAFATGIPTTLGGTPAVEIYEDNSVTQITAAETLTPDFDSITGLNNLRIAATAANGFEAGKSYSAVISTGTVGGVSVVGEVVAQFSIERSAALAEIGTAGAGLTEAGGTGDQLTAVPNVAGIAGTIQTLDALDTAQDTQHTTTQGKVDTAQADLDILTGADGVNLLSATQASIDAIETDTDTTIPALIAALNDLSAAEVNAEVLDVVNVDTFAELAADPGASPTIVKALMLLYMALRNKVDVDATTKEIHNDAGTVLLTKTLSDNGTVYSETKMA